MVYNIAEDVLLYRAFINIMQLASYVACMLCINALKSMLQPSFEILKSEIKRQRY